LRYQCHLKAETTNTKVIKEVLAAVGIFSKNQLWIKNLFDFYLTKWYNYAISYQGEDPYVRKKFPTTVILLLYGRYDSQKPYFKTHQ